MVLRDLVTDIWTPANRLEPELRPLAIVMICRLDPHGLRPETQFAGAAKPPQIPQPDDQIRVICPQLPAGFQASMCWRNKTRRQP